MSGGTALRLAGWAAAAALAALMSGCTGKTMQDLQDFVAEVKARPKGRIEPLPEIKQVEPYFYSAGELRDPFTPEVELAAESSEPESAQGGGIRPIQGRHREELEYFPLDSMRMVGTLEQDESTWALVVTKEGTIHRVLPGNYLGENHGRIIRITESKIELTEIIPNGQGGYRERQATLALGEQ